MGQGSRQGSRQRNKALARHARNAKALASSQAPPKPRKKRKVSRGRIPKQTVRKAIQDSYGNKETIRDRLGCAHSTVGVILNRKGWEDLRELFDYEREKLNDLAENVLVEQMVNGDSEAVASRNAQFVLERLGRNRGYGKESTVNVQGGDNPVRVEHTIPIENLKLPLAIRRLILEAIERQEESRMIEGRVVG